MSEAPSIRMLVSPEMVRRLGTRRPFCSGERCAFFQDHRGPCADPYGVRVPRHTLTTAEVEALIEADKAMGDGEYQKE